MTAPAPLPSRMSTIEVQRYGDPDVLSLGTRPLPHVGDDDVLIEVHAAGVGRPDILQRRGMYAPPPGASDILGLEVAGLVAQVGKRASQFKPGDRVCALLSGGGYAEYAVANAGMVLPIPANWSFVEAATVPENVFTTWVALFERGLFQSGKKVLVHGGTSGVGSTAIMMASSMGGIVFATAGSETKRAACLEFGAKAAFNYRETDFVEDVQRATEGAGVDIVLDIVAGEYVQRNLETLARNGRLVLLAFPNGKMAEFDVGLVISRKLTIVGTNIRSRSIAEKSALAAEIRKAIWPLLEQKRIRPIVDGVFPMRDAEKAHTRLESSAHIGKIVLEVRPS